MLNLSPTDWIAIAGVYITILGSVWTLGQYLNNRFSKVFEKIEAVKETILSKLEYHERHDDKRFSEIKNEIWETRLNMLSRQPVKNVKKDQDAE